MEPLHYDVYEGRGTGWTCFIHGFMGSARAWQPIVQALTTRTNVVCIDLPGHGQSTERPRYLYSMEGATQALADVLDALRITACTLVGYSMGGRVALYFACFHPTRVQRLLLESAHPGLERATERTARRGLDAERALRIQNDFRGFLERWYRQPLFASLAQHDLVEPMIDARMQNDPSELARALEGMGTGTQPPLWEELAQCARPVRYITGALDRKYTAVARRIAQRCPAVGCHVVEGAGHNVHAERPQAFIGHLSDFVQAP
ncbi:2-succinyl-6-hydroxy-2,4-cyclohexadiene-1-carboxylate synthase [Salisaeta longa]|uniref:2-succinyl-6-hydroxy-2, 4-cyclohexadiene-1-carboxylate synthase n=1 Tax=Salisaeta longa TaxID=503170 RepID=UPI0006879174|nr:2-succinyl-6-hydroxy-2,4-cyclohexadiene-1-carboxylate synthase [Salisaeta longa]